MIIETFGLAAAGKSTYARRFAAENNLPLVDVPSRAETYFYFLLFRLLNGRLSSALSTRCRQQIEPNERMRRRKRILYWKAGAREQKARILGGGLIDEGLLNFLLTLYETEIPAEDLELFGRLMGRKGRELHIVEADQDARSARIAERTQFARRDVGPEYFETWSRVTLKNYEKLRAWIKENRAYKVIDS
jgi:hypothetical protein